MTNILISGGTGFIGSRLALHHRSQGDHTTILSVINNDREATVAKSLEAAGVHIAQVDVRDKSAVDKVMSGMDIVYHLAAAQHEAGAPNEYFHTINVEGTKNVLDACLKHRPGKILHGSTIGVYGVVSDGVAVDETTQTAPDNIYGVTKLQGEQLAMQYSDQIDISIVRISETYGPGDFRLLKMFKSAQKGMFPIIGDGLNIHQLIYVDDLIAGFDAVSRLGKAGEIYLLGGNEQITTRDMVTLVRKAVGRSSSVPTIPMLPMSLAASTLEILFKPFGKTPPLHQRRLDFFKKSFRLNCQKAFQDVGFEPKVSFAAGAERTANWYTENNYL